MERRIQAAIYGEPHRDFSAIIGWKALGKLLQTALVQRRLHIFNRH
jgi:hypothetical protein